LAFFWGLIVLKNEGWLPFVFGGDMSLKELLTDVLVKTIPFGSPSKAVVDYGLYCAGYHYTELIRHALFSYHQSDYAEMFVHHICAVSLLAGYLWANFHCGGIFFATLHDAVDIFTALARLFQGSIYKNTISGPSMVVMWFVWLYTRILILPYSLWILERHLIPIFHSFPQS